MYSQEIRYPPVSVALKAPNPLHSPKGSEEKTTISNGLAVIFLNVLANFFYERFEMVVAALLLMQVNCEIVLAVRLAVSL